MHTRIWPGSTREKVKGARGAAVILSICVNTRVQLRSWMCTACKASSSIALTQKAGSTREHSRFSVAGWQKKRTRNQGAHQRWLFSGKNRSEESVGRDPRR